MGHLLSKSSTPTKGFTLKALLAAYTSSHRLAAEALNACQHAEKDPTFQTVFVHHVHTVLSGRHPSPADLRLAFLRRLHSAVYFGTVCAGSFDVERLRAHLGRRLPMPLTNDDDQQLRMVVGGRVYVAPRFLPSPTFKVSVVSLYAPNCESTATSDYQHLFRARYPGGYPAFNAGLYVDILNATIRTAVTMAATDLKHTAVALPAVGLGAYAAHIPREDIRNLVESLVDSFVDVCRHCSVRPLIFPYGHDRTARQFARAAQEWGIDVSEGDLFKAPEVAHRLGGNDVAIINAWDTRSLIGNGLLADPTVDGFMASGGGPGATLPNSSFYHNVVVIQSALADLGLPAVPPTPLAMEPPYGVDDRLLLPHEADNDWRRPRAAHEPHTPREPEDGWLWSNAARVRHTSREPEDDWRRPHAVHEPHCSPPSRDDWGQPQAAAREPHRPRRISAPPAPPVPQRAAPSAPEFSSLELDERPRLSRPGHGPGIGAVERDAAPHPALRHAANSWRTQERRHEEEARAADDARVAAFHQGQGYYAAQEPRGDRARAQAGRTRRGEPMPDPSRVIVKGASVYYQPKGEWGAWHGWQGWPGGATVGSYPSQHAPAGATFPSEAKGAAQVYPTDADVGSTRPPPAAAVGGLLAPSFLDSKATVAPPPTQDAGIEVHLADTEPGTGGGPPPDGSHGASAGASGEHGFLHDGVEEGGHGKTDDRDDRDGHDDYDRGEPCHRASDVAGWTTEEEDKVKVTPTGGSPGRDFADKHEEAKCEEREGPAGATSQL